MSSKIFVVEDERIVAEDIRLTLESFGYEVVGIAASRDQALEEIRRTEPDLVLMDIILQGQGDGVEAGRLVRDLFATPVIYLTAHADAGTLHRAKVTEPFGYVLKPFEGIELHSAIQMALYRKQVDQRIASNEQWLNTVLASISDGVIAADAIGLVKLVNAAAERVTGWTEEEAMNRELGEIYAIRNAENQDVAELPALVDMLRDPSQCGARQDRILMRKDGSTIRIEQSLSLISDGGKVVSGSVVVFREVSV